MEDLRDSYTQVAERLLEVDDFREEELQSSRAVFDPLSLSERTPRPANLDVVALVGGLPFDERLVQALCLAQREIAELVEDALAYWVLPPNLAVEVCVFKWPGEILPDGRFPEIRDAVRTAGPRAFSLVVHGVQVHRDGAVVARGFDGDGELRRLRERLLTDLPWMSRQQSGWAHVPLGRILEPAGNAAFRRLGEASPRLWNSRIGTTEIKSLQLVVESQWYMEDRSTDTTFDLERGGP
jgi:hypothetical protein